MDVTLDKRYPLAVTVEQAWTVLADIHAVAGCMPGAAITEQLDATHYKGTVKTKIGPASMQFGGDIEVLAMDAAARSMQMVGKGTDKSGSSASMDLTAHLEVGETPGTSVLVGQAKVIVNGKLAQFGSRLLVPVSDAMLTQFANNFRVAAAAVPVVSSTPPDAEPEPAVTAAVTAAAAVAATTSDTAIAAPAPVAVAEAQPPNELNALGLMWVVFKGWIAGLFGRRT